MTPSEPVEPVVLRGGTTVAFAALQLAWALEGRGLTFRVAEDGRLLIGPRHLLTPADREAIRAHRDELVVLVHYCQQVKAPC